MLKKGKKFPLATPKTIALSNNCTPEKMNDVLNLVKKIGHQDHEFYQHFETLTPKLKPKKGKQDTDVCIKNVDLF